MQNLDINPTLDTPKVFFDEAGNTLQFLGKSYPDDVFLFYSPIWEWLKNYDAASKEVLTVIFKLEYFNTASAKAIYDVLKILDTIALNGGNVKIIWYYENMDEDMKEAGEGYQELISANIELIGY